MYFRVVCLLTLLCGASSLKTFQNRIPNGHRVPHPCFINNIWQGVGHKFNEGGGELNPFGRDFKENGYKWDTCLCEHDSDGDGKSNGEELGDPNCVFVEGGMPENSAGLGHPGICEPLNDPKCAETNNWNVCEDLDFQCDATKEEDVEELDLIFNNTMVPSDETTYYCVAVNFPDDKPYHAFAMEAIVDNAFVVHHIDMYECEGGMKDWANTEYPYPKQCHAMSGCGGNMIAAWAVGIKGHCLGGDHGIPMGQNGAQTAILRIHYHNPEHLENQIDNSGLRMYMTPNLRQYDTQIINLGQMYLELPPQLPSIEDDITCGPSCTNTFKEKIYIVYGAYHMHYMGKSAVTELWRDGQKVREIMRQDNYDYNAPLILSFEDDPIEVQPGDTIKHTCEFFSTGIDELTYRGQAATDEMCHAYFVHYPAQNLTECFNWGTTQTCKFRYQDGREEYPRDCDISDFDQHYNSWMKAALEANCDKTGKECLPGCAGIVESVEAAHICTTDEYINWTKHRTGWDFRRMMNSCKVWPTAPPQVTPTPLPPGQCGLVGGEGDGASAAALDVLLAVALLSIYRFVV